MVRLEDGEMKLILVVMVGAVVVVESIMKMSLDMDGSLINSSTSS
jgi:hypothetical protein